VSHTPAESLKPEKLCAPRVEAKLQPTVDHLPRVAVPSFWNRPHTTGHWAPSEVEGIGAIAGFEAERGLILAGAAPAERP